jgi:putative SOS response-associated peptidase YedK
MHRLIIMPIYPRLSGDKVFDSDRAMLDRTAEALAETFDLAGSVQGTWGNWPYLSDLRPGQPAFVLRRTREGLTLDTQRWDISAGGIGGSARCWPTTRILSVSLPWWRRLAERPAQRCLIPVTACTAPLPPQGGRDGRSAWFTLADEPVFTIAGLWRGTSDARCFAMLGCPVEGPLTVQPVVIAPGDRVRWLDAEWDAAASLLAPMDAERICIGLSETPLSDVGAPLYAGGGPNRPPAGMNLAR